MAAKQTETGNPSPTAWFDEATQTPLIADHARRLDSFLSAMADGEVNDDELHAQESRLVKLMKEVEPRLDPALHDKVTQLLCELTAYDIMQAVHIMHEARPKTVFRG
jgi:hypothetical protein